MKILIKNGTVVTMNKSREVFTGDVLVEGNEILATGPSLSAGPGAHEIYDASGQIVIPGFIQAHTHLVQTFFRGEADDLALLEWLKKRVWPLEAAHNEASITSSVEFGVIEMMKLGTTSILDMATVRHTDVLLETVAKMGLRYWGGKCLMDNKPLSGPLYEPTKKSLEEMEFLIEKWRDRSESVRYAICPRFAVSCTEDMLRASSDLQKKNKLLIHTHASESLDEIRLVKKLTGKGNIRWLSHVGLLNKNSVIAHGVHLSDADVKDFKKAGAGLVHCPSSNLKLGSGIAPIWKYWKAGIKKIGLGADGAPCNNIMDPFKELHLSAMLQKPLYGPKAMPAATALELATLGGARVLGMEKHLGSLEAGKYADIVCVDTSHLSVMTVTDPYSALVYSCSGRDVKSVMINGRWHVKDRAFKYLDEDRIRATVVEQKRSLFQRAKV